MRFSSHIIMHECYSTGWCITASPASITKVWSWSFYVQNNIPLRCDVKDKHSKYTLQSRQWLIKSCPSCIAWTINLNFILINCSPILQPLKTMGNIWNLENWNSLAMFGLITILFVCLLELVPEGKSVSDYINTHNKPACPLV